MKTTKILFSGMLVGILFTWVNSYAFAKQTNTSPVYHQIVNSSLNWAGYVATGGTYTQVSGTWTIPSVANTNSLSADAAWVGIGGIGSQDLVQAGTQAITGQGNTTQYQAWVETLPQASEAVPLTVNPGDSVSVGINLVSGNTWQFNFTDNTTNQSYSTTRQYNSNLSSAEWIEEMPSSVVS